MNYAEFNTLIYKSMHFLLLELCVDSFEKTTLNQPQIMGEKRVPAVGLEAKTFCILSPGGDTKQKYPTRLNEIITF